MTAKFETLHKDDSNNSEGFLLHFDSSTKTLLNREAEVHSELNS